MHIKCLTALSTKVTLFHFSPPCSTIERCDQLESKNPVLKRYNLVAMASECAFSALPFLFIFPAGIARLRIAIDQQSSSHCRDFDHIDLTHCSIY